MDLPDEKNLINEKCHSWIVCVAATTNATLCRKPLRYLRRSFSWRFIISSAFLILCVLKFKSSAVDPEVRNPYYLLFKRFLFTLLTTFLADENEETDGVIWRRGWALTCILVKWPRNWHLPYTCENFLIQTVKLFLMKFRNVFP